jgi:hypothetical protein
MTDDDPIVAFVARQPDLHRRLLIEHIDDGTGHREVCTVGGWPCNVALYVARVSQVGPSPAPMTTTWTGWASTQGAP